MIYAESDSHFPLSEIEGAIAAAPSGRHADITRRVTNLFLTQSADFSDAQVDLFGQVLERLIDKIETSVLAELGQRLAIAPKAPLTVIQHLARHDDIIVARPVLAMSVALSDEDLIEVSETKSQAHLLAISERTVLPEPVTDVLVRRGDTGVTRSVASNPGARFSETGFDILSARASSDELLAEMVAQRADVPPHIFGLILVQASAAVRCRMLAAAPPERHAELTKILGEILGRVADQAPLARDYGPATRRILLAYPEGHIEEADVLHLVLSRHYEDVVAALSVVSAVPVDTIDQMMSDAPIEPLLFLCKALGFGWTSTRSLLQLTHGMRLSADALMTTCEDFGKIPVAAAKRMLSYWQLDRR